MCEENIMHYCVVCARRYSYANNQCAAAPMAYIVRIPVVLFFCFWPTTIRMNRDKCQRLVRPEDSACRFDW